MGRRSSLVYCVATHQLPLCCRHTLEGHGGWLSDVAITYNGTRGVTVSGDELAVVWDLHSGVCLNVLEGHSNGGALPSGHCLLHHRMVIGNAG